MTTSLPTRGCFLQLEKNAKDDNKPFDLLLSSTIKEKKSKMMTSRDLGSLSLFGTKEKNTKRQQRVRRLIIIFYNGRKIIKDDDEL
jgi:hypothetical protein